MWAYGAHYTCNDETAHSPVTFDSGIAAIPPTPTCTAIDVGILKNILLVTYVGLSMVLMEGSWIKSVDHGRRVVKKDQYRFGMVHYLSREVRPKDNPSVYPASLSQVFFVGDSVDPAWKVVLRHDPRSTRIQGDRDFHVFGASGSSRPSLSVRSDIGNRHDTSASVNEGRDQAEEVPVDQVNAFILHEERPDDEAHLDDTQWEDKVELQFVE